MVQLRLYTFDRFGKEIYSTWTFSPLVDEDAYDIYRENTTSASGELRRRPTQEREVRIITLGAGLLLNAEDWANFRLLLRAHKITWFRAVGKPTNFQWVEYKLDEQERISFTHESEVMRLRRIVITLVQAKALSFTDFNNTTVQLVDEL